MISYGDRTYCTYWQECQFKKCPRALTDSVKELAREWWGDDNPPIAVYADRPECFIERRELDD